MKLIYIIKIDSLFSQRKFHSAAFVWIFQNKLKTFCRFSPSLWTGVSTRWRRRLWKCFSLQAFPLELSLFTFHLRGGYLIFESFIQFVISAPHVCSLCCTNTVWLSKVLWPHLFYINPLTFSHCPMSEQCQLWRQVKWNYSNLCRFKFSFLRENIFL